MKTIFLALALTPGLGHWSTANAQWLDYPTPGVPKTPDGRPNLNAPTPRTRDGHPDLSGLWKPQNTMTNTDNFHPAGTFFDIATGMKGGLPYQPWAAERVRKNRENDFKDQPDGKCLPLSPTQADTHNDIRRLLQTPEMLILLFEKNTTYRTVHIDGRALESDPEPSWRGYSIGKWDGDTLVVQTNGLKADTWLDYVGSPITPKGKLFERFRRRNYGNLDVEIAVDDPEAYTKPWTVTVNWLISLNTEPMEFVCDNEQDQKHMVGK
jgi:hypothetical protein